MVVLRFVPNEGGQSVTARPAESVQMVLIVGSADRVTNATRSLGVILDRKRKLLMELGL